MYGHGSAAKAGELKCIAAANAKLRTDLRVPAAAAENCAFRRCSVDKRGGIEVGAAVRMATVSIIARGGTLGRAFYADVPQ